MPQCLSSENNTITKFFRRGVSSLIINQCFVDIIDVIEDVVPKIEELPSLLQKEDLTFP